MFNPVSKRLMYSQPGRKQIKQARALEGSSTKVLNQEMCCRRKDIVGHAPVVLACATLLLVCFSLLPVYAASGIGGAAPFSFKITPKSATVRPGETVPFHASVNASAGLSDAIAFSLAIGAPGYSVTLSLGTVNPPYPKEYDFSVKIPAEIPMPVTAQGVVMGTGGSFSQTETIQISIQSQSSGGDFLSWLTNVFGDFWNWLMRLLGRT